MKDQLIRYEEICLLLDSLSEEKERLAAFIKDEMVNQNATKTPMLTRGRIHLQKRVRWEYSDELQSKMDMVEQLKKHEQMTGDAEPCQTSFLVYRKAK